MLSSSIFLLSSLKIRRIKVVYFFSSIVFRFTLLQLAKKGFCKIGFPQAVPPMVAKTLCCRNPPFCGEIMAVATELCVEVLTRVSDEISLSGQRRKN